MAIRPVDFQSASLPLAASTAPGAPVADGPTTLAATMPMFYQGPSNACGTTSLAMVLSYLTGSTVDRRDIDASIRRFDVFASPPDMMDYARRAGVAAEGYNHGSKDELERFIDAGIPTELVITDDGSHSLSSLHCVVPVAHHRDPATGEEVFTIHDPARGKTEVPWSELDRQWSGPPVGFDHYFMAFAPRGSTLPPGRDDGVHGTLVASGGLTALMNATERLIHPHDPFDPRPDLRALERGARQAVTGAAEAGFGFVSDAVEDAASVLAARLRRLFA
jgi:hypothetical protein